MTACREAVGTPAGFLRHRRAAEDPCDPCAGAMRTDSRTRRAVAATWRAVQRELRWLRVTGHSYDRDEAS